MSAQEFAGMVSNDTLPWNWRWSDSTKEQYFDMLNAEQANEHEIEMWRLNNEYNTPEKQMERMVAAGINPAAAYQQVSSGNSSSVPGTHQAQTAHFHDTTDKLAKINTMMTGVKTLFDIAGQVIEGVGGVQDIALTHQNNWYNQMRANFWNNSELSPQYWISTKKDYFPKSFEVAPGLFMDAGVAQLFPEFVQGFKQAYNAPNFNLAELQRQDQHAIAARQTRVDRLIQDIFRDIENNASESAIIRKLMELFVYGAFSKNGISY